MDGITEEDAKRWLAHAQRWRTQQHCEVWCHMAELATFLEKLRLVIETKGSARAVLQELPSVGKLLGALSQNPVVQCSEEVVLCLITCILGIASHTDESKQDNVMQKAVNWAQSQLRNMTSSACPDPNILSIGEFLGFTAQETTEGFVKNLVQSIRYDLMRFQGVKWNPEISDLEPITPLHGSTIRALSEMCVPLVPHAAATPLVETLLSSAEKATDIILSTSAGSHVATDCLSPLFLDRISQLSSSGVLQLAYSVKVKLWRRHQASFENKILDFVENTVFAKPSLSQREIKEKLQSSDLGRACSENLELRLAADQILCSMLRQTGGNRVVGDIRGALAAEAPIQDTATHI